MMKPKTVTIAGFVGASAAALAMAAPAQAAPTPSGPPPGSKELQSKTLRYNTQYERYSNKKLSPKQVLAYYKKKLRADGWRTVSEGGGGSAWSDGWGGGGGGLTAMHDGIYLSVNAGGYRTTYFEVCTGRNSNVVRHCEDESDRNSSESSGS